MVLWCMVMGSLDSRFNCRCCRTRVNGWFASNSTCKFTTEQIDSFIFRFTSFFTNLLKSVSYWISTVKITSHKCASFRFVSIFWIFLLFDSVFVKQSSHNWMEGRNCDSGSTRFDPWLNPTHRSRQGAKSHIIGPGKCEGTAKNNRLDGERDENNDHSKPLTSKICFVFSAR